MTCPKPARIWKNIPTAMCHRCPDTLRCPEGPLFWTGEAQIFHTSSCFWLKWPWKSASQQNILAGRCFCLSPASCFFIFHFVDCSYMIPLHRSGRHQMTVQTSSTGGMIMSPKPYSLSGVSTHGQTALWKLSQWRRSSAVANSKWSMFNMSWTKRATGMLSTQASTMW